MLIIGHGYIIKMHASCLFSQLLNAFCKRIQYCSLISCHRIIIQPWFSNYLEINLERFIYGLV